MSAPATIAAPVQEPPVLSTPIDDRRVPARSPWGQVDFARIVADDVVEVSTPSHGGVKLGRARNARVHEAWRRRGGWYEEDCDARIVEFTFPELFPWLDRVGVVAAVKRWHPDAYEQVTGERVTAGESHIVAEREFMAAHANDWITVSASGSWADGVPKGMVGVVAIVGGRQGGQDWSTRRRFLVPEADYDARHPVGFVVDPALHGEWIEEA